MAAAAAAGRSRVRLPSASVLILTLLAGATTLMQAAHGATVINFAMLWPETNMANTTQALFNRIFLPALRNSCAATPGFNDMQFKFIDLPQVALLNITLVKQQISLLSSQNCLFLGAYQVSGRSIFEQAKVPSGVTGFGNMAVHSIAPITLELVEDGLMKALTASFNLPTRGFIANKLAIIIGTGYSVDQLEKLVNIYPGGVYVYPLKQGTEYWVIRAAKERGVTNFLLAATSKEAGVMLIAAYDSLMLSPRYRWFLFNVRLVDKNDFAGFKVVSRNITSMEFGPISTAIEHNLSRAAEIYVFDLLSMWNIYLKKIVCKEPGEVNQTYSGMTGNFLLSPNGSIVRTDWRMSFYGGLGSERERIGNWTYSGNFSFSKPPDRVANDVTIISELKKNTFRVVTLLKPPFVQFKAGFENDSSTNVTLYNRLEGYAIDICKQMLANLSIDDVSFFFQEDGQHGSQDNLGNWNGIVQTLMQGKADMACASLSDTEARRTVIKFTQSYLSFQLSILYAKKTENPLVSMFQFMRPFHLYTWLAVIGSVVALSIVLAVLHRLSRNVTGFSMNETIFFSFASLIQGITGTPPDRPSGQVVIAIYWLFAFVILVAYVTNYAASRTLSRLQSDITSLSTLYAQTTYNYGTLGNTAYVTLLQTSMDTTQQKIFRYISSDPINRILPNLTVALNMVGNGSFAFIYDSAMNDYYKQFICNSVNTGFFSTQSASFGLPMTAEYDTIFNNALANFTNSGQRQKLYTRYFEVSAKLLPNCISSEFPTLLQYYIPDDPPIFGTKSGALTLANTLGIAVINLVGSVLTLLLATVELIYVRCSRWRKRRKQRAKKKKADLESEAMPKNADGDPFESTA